MNEKPKNMYRYGVNFPLKITNATGKCDQICQKGSIRAQFQVPLFTAIRQIQQWTNSPCLYYCQRFKGLLLLRPHLWACLASTGAQVACKWLQLAWPDRQPAENHPKTSR